MNTAKQQLNKYKTSSISYEYCQTTTQQIQNLFNKLYSIISFVQLKKKRKKVPIYRSRFHVGFYIIFNFLLPHLIF